MTPTIQNNIPVLQLTDMRSLVQNMYTTPQDDAEFITTLLWLGHLCCRGELTPVLDFLKSQPADLQVRYVNESHDAFWDGTLLHMVTYWNSTPNAFVMYMELRAMGAFPTKDYYNVFPWEINSTLYIVPCDDNNYGIRTPMTFSTLYLEISMWEKDLNENWEKSLSRTTISE